MLDADTISIHDLFGGPRQFRIPVYQRHYVWTQEDQWKPLWQDIQDKIVENAQVEVDQDRNPHFVGAIVIRQLHRRVGAVPAYDIIDGQQRLTTFQIILCAIADVCNSVGLKDIGEQAEEFITNSGLLRLRHANQELRDSKESYKIILTRTDKASFDALIDRRPNQASGTIKEAYVFFREAIKDYRHKYISEIEVLKDPRNRMTYLLDTILQDFKVVQILIDAHANSERIFESINARGRTINEFDHLRNNIFLKARVANMDVQALHDDHWMHFTDSIWTKSSDADNEGMLISEYFLQHFLMAKLKKESIVHRDLFHTYEREYRANLNKNQGVEYELLELEKYSKAYQVMIDCRYDSSRNDGLHSGRRMRLIADRMEFYKHLEITSLHPFILFIVSELEIPDEELETIFDILESYTMRRLLCTNQMNPTYNELFAAIPASVGRVGQVSAELARYLSTLESNEKFPDDDDVKRALSRCGDDSFERVITRYILYRVELYKTSLNSTLGDDLRFSNQLTIEHVMPKQWRENWSEQQTDPAKTDLVVRSIGNLTLLTKDLNEALGNQSFSEKRGPLLENGDLNLTREIVYESMNPIQVREEWGVKQILNREKDLWKCFCEKLWRGISAYLTRYPGEVKNWHPTFTKGFIIDEEGQEIPVEASEFQHLDIPSLKKGTQVTFEKVSTLDGFKAIKVIKTE